MGDAPEEWVAAYDVAMRKLHDADADLAASVRAWLLDDVGNGPALLGAVQSSLSTRGRPMSGNFFVDGQPEAVRVLLQGLPSLSPQLAGRFVGLMLASNGHSGHSQPASFHGFLAAVRWSCGEPWGEEPIAFPVSFLERMCAAYGLPTSQPLLEAHASIVYWRGTHQDEAQVRRFDGYAEYVGRHEEPMRKLLTGTKVPERLAALELVQPLPDDLLTPYAAELAVLATSGSVKVRAVAEPLLGRCGEAATKPLRSIAETGKPDARMWALRRLWAEGDADQKAWCEQRAEADKAGPVRMLVEEWSSLADVAPDEAPVEKPVFDWHETVSEADIAKLRAAVTMVNERGEQVDPAAVDQLVGALAAGRPTDLPRPKSEQSHLLWTWRHRTEGESALGPAGTAAVLLLDAELFRSYGRQELDSSAIIEFSDLYARTGRPTLTELAVMVDDLGEDGGTIVLLAWGHGGEWGFGLGPRPEAEVAEFTAFHLDAVLAHVAPAERPYGLDKRAPHRALATLPELPARAVDHLYAVALGPQKVERRAAQDLLDRVPGITTRIIPVLGDSRADQRAEAAAWLGRLRDPAVVEPLEKAFAQEKQDVPMAAMLDSLTQLGRPVEDYVRPDDLAEQARTAVAKGLPKELEWFRWDRMPTVRWANGTDVPPEVLQWFLSQAVKAKSPEPNALLRTYASLFEPGSREELGQFVLEAWVAQDVRTIPADRARQQAEWEAQHTLSNFRRYPQHYTDHPLFGRTEAEIVAAVLPRHLREVVGSASSSRGVLAVASACAGDGAAPVVQRYLKTWQALRRTQGQALVAMLAWVDRPAAIQVLLSVGSRFRSKSIQAEATKQAEALAARKGWTFTELEDRSVPVAGLDEDGVLELSYGERTFTARLLPDLTLELRSPEDTVVKALPAARVADDAEAVKEAKKAFSATKKELAAVLEHQTARLYEALCTQRAWSFEVWQRYVLGHPVLRHLASRLVWSVDGVLVRPLGDGSLTDVEDAPVQPDEHADVTLAHDSLVPADVASAWVQHLVDYEVVPLFRQFGRGTFTLTEDLRSADSLRELEGTMLESFVLRGHADKLGYHRGEAGDAATFTTYEKSFAGVGLTAVVNFSGNTLPEENVPVALTELTIERRDPRGVGTRVPLGDVPPVLLSETWNDAREIADAGTGIDPGWQSKVLY